MSHPGINPALWTQGVGWVCALLGFAGAGLLAVRGSRWGLIDKPGPRSSHSRPTPKGGGVGILAAFVLAAIWLRLPPLLWLAVAGVSGVSFLGDRVRLSPRLRLLVQFAAAAAALTPLAGTFPQALAVRAGLLVGLPLASFLVVATANTYNFMDGIDGLAGITGAVAFGLLAVTGSLRGEDPAWVALAVALAAACLGFLPWNFPRARVFSGDVGSILLGFVFALFVAAWSRTPADLLLFVSFLFPFLADEGVTLLARLRRGDPLLVPHRRHVYQILANQRGIAHQWISLAYGAGQLGVGAVAIWLCPPGWPWRLSWLVLAAALYLSLARRVRRWE